MDYNYRYFVSYAHVLSGNIGFGCCEVKCIDKITDMKDVNQLKDGIETSQGISVKKENELTDKAIDIRKLKNYQELKSTDIIFNREKMVVSLIKEAVRKGYVKPV